MGLSLTKENVEFVLDKVRPLLQNDGGDCKVTDIDGHVVKVELQGACSSCPSSTITLKMGIERTLREHIPDINEVVAVMPNSEPPSREGVEDILDEVRPFLAASGGALRLLRLGNPMKPRVVIEMTGPALRSTAVRVEIGNRLKEKYPMINDLEFVGANSV